MLYIKGYGKGRQQDYGDHIWELLGLKFLGTRKAAFRPLKEWEPSFRSEFNESERNQIEIAIYATGLLSRKYEAEPITLSWREQEENFFIFNQGKTMDIVEFIQVWTYYTGASQKEALDDLESLIKIGVIKD